MAEEVSSKSVVVAAAMLTAAVMTGAQKFLVDPRPDPFTGTQGAILEQRVEAVERRIWEIERGHKTIERDYERLRHELERRLASP